MRKMLPIYRPQGESRQSTIERLRSSLVPTNQESCGDKKTIVDVANPAGKFTQFVFAGHVGQPHIEQTIKDTFAWQDRLRGAGVRLPKIAPNSLTVKRNQAGQFRDGDKNKFRGADIKLGRTKGPSAEEQLTETT